MRCFAQLGSGDRLDVQGPLPARLERETPDRATADLHELEPPLLESPDVVGLAEGLLLRRDACCHVTGPPGGAVRADVTHDCILAGTGCSPLAALPPGPPTRCRAVPTARCASPGCAGTP